MQWEIINTQPLVPRCTICRQSTDQMARFTNPILQYVYICSDCARFVKDAMNKWEGLKDVNYINDVGKYYDSKFLDKVIEENKDKALFPDVGPSETGYHRRGKRLL